MSALAYVVVMLIVAALSYYAAMRAQKRNNINAQTVEQPTVNQGDRFGKLFGTRWIKNPKVVYLSPATTEPIQK